MRILKYLLCIAVVAPLCSAAADEVRACSKAERQEYVEQLVLAVLDAWQGPDFGESYSCSVVIAVNFRGEVLNVGVEDCSRDDPSVRKSVEDAAYAASPLPLPENRLCLGRTVRITLTRRVPG